MKNISLTRKSLMQFLLCVAILLLLATPLFYLLTKNFYAEDVIKIVRAVNEGNGVPPLDLESDVVQGVMIQFGLIVIILGVAMLIVMGLMSRRMWAPFYQTLHCVENFHLEDGVVPKFQNTNISEFNRLNSALTQMISDSLHSYQLQKEFTENASHELQTPLAVFQSKLDLLLQQSELTRDQAEIIQDLYQMSGRLSRLSRNLLLLAKMDSRQYGLQQTVDIVGVVSELMPYMESLAQGLSIETVFDARHVEINANRSLLESLISNLIVNAVRHNREGGRIVIHVSPAALSIANTSDEPPLDSSHIFDRFYRSQKAGNGYGLGLAIVKAVCTYHHWGVDYRFQDGLHIFNVRFR